MIEKNMLKKDNNTNDYRVPYSRTCMLVSHFVNWCISKYNNLKDTVVQYKCVTFKIYLLKRDRFKRGNSGHSGYLFDGHICTHQ